MKEMWKSVYGYENYYEVSNKGRVRSVDRFVVSAINYNDKVTRKGKILKCNLKKNGYYTVDLSMGNKKKTVSIHRLVADAFVDKVEGCDIVNHINLNKLDNRFNNLEWVTYKQNTQHAAKNGKIYCGARKTIICIDSGTIFDSSYKAAEWLNANKYGNSKSVDSMSKNIRACCFGNRKSAYGYRWKDYNIESSTTSL